MSERTGRRILELADADWRLRFRLDGLPADYSADLQVWVEGPSPWSAHFVQDVAVRTLPFVADMFLDAAQARICDRSVNMSDEPSVTFDVHRAADDVVVVGFGPSGYDTTRVFAGTPHAQKVRVSADVLVDAAHWFVVEAQRFLPVSELQAYADIPRDNSARARQQLFTARVARREADAATDRAVSAWLERTYLDALDDPSTPREIRAEIEGLLHRLPDPGPD